MANTPTPIIPTGNYAPDRIAGEAGEILAAWIAKTDKNLRVEIRRVAIFGGADYFTAEVAQALGKTKRSGKFATYSNRTALPAVGDHPFTGETGLAAWDALRAAIFAIGKDGDQHTRIATWAREDLDEGTRERARQDAEAENAAAAQGRVAQ